MISKFSCAVISLSICGMLISCDSKSTSTESRSNPESSSASSAPNQDASQPKGETTLATLAGFKQDVAKLQSWYQQEQETLMKKVPTREEMETLKSSFLEKARQIQTEGLPADLQATWKSFVAISSELDALMRKFPKLEPGAPQLLQQAMEAVKPQLDALQQQASGVGSKLLDLGRKYGISELESFTPKENPTQ